MNEEYEDINLKELFFIICKRWWIILISIVVLVAITLVSSLYLIVPSYRAETTLFVGKEKKGDEVPTLDYNQLRINQQLISDYRELVRSRVVINEVIKEQKLSLSINSLKSRVKVTPMKDTRIFSITLTDDNPQFATTVLNKLADIFIIKAKEIVDVENIQVIDRATVPTKPISPNVKRNVIIAFLLGGVLGLMIIFCIEFFDNRLKNTEDIEKHLGLTVIGRIPMFLSEAKKKSNEQKATQP